MIDSTQDPIAFASGTRSCTYRWMAAASLSIVIGTASASVPTSNELGVRFTVITSGPPATVEIRLTPRQSFDTVDIEAASGVASLAPPCAFSNVVAGGSYVCRVDVTGKPSDPAMTINVVAQHARSGNGLPETEIHHLSVKNKSFLPSKKAQAASHHVVASSSATSK